MSTNLQLFSFNALQVRVVNIDGNPWFVAVDVCQILGLRNVSQAILRLNTRNKDIYQVEYLGTYQSMLCVSVSGVYQLILSTRSLVASSFQDWVYQLVDSFKKPAAIQSANLKWQSFNGSQIRFEVRDGRVWVNLTDMAQASDKRVHDWSRLDSTVEFISTFSSVAGIPVTETIQGGQPELQGTWAIEEVAIKFAAWCSVSFEIWMLTQIKTLMTQGSVSLVKPDLEKEKDNLEMKKMMLALATAVDTQNEKIKLLEGSQSLVRTIKTELSNLADIERFVKLEILSLEELELIETLYIDTYSCNSKYILSLVKPMLIHTEEGRKVYHKVKRDIGISYLRFTNTPLKKIEGSYHFTKQNVWFLFWKLDLVLKNLG